MTEARPKLLIIEDDLGLCSQYRWAFPACDVVFAHDRAQAVAMVLASQPAVAIMDLGLPPDPDGVSEGFATLDHLAMQAPATKVIVATSHGDRSHAVRAIAAGAYDFCEKPIDITVLSAIVDRSLRLHTLETDRRRTVQTAAPAGIVLTGDAAMEKIGREIAKLAVTNVPVLLLGELATGKAALARALHDGGARRNGPFVALSCANTPSALLETELFGQERWGFAGIISASPGLIEAAEGGTLYLDEIADLPRVLQARLLGLLRDHTFERVGGRAPVTSTARIVTATAQDLQSRLAAGSFAGDLYYRLTAMSVRVPPLRDRGGDAVLLARHFLAEFAPAFGRAVRGLSEDAVAAIGTHPWPGNIRELESRMRRAVVMAEGRLVTAPDLELAPGVEDMTAYDLRSARARAERDVVARAVARSNGTLATAARLLGVSRPTLYSLLEAHGLNPGPAAEAETDFPDGPAQSPISHVRSHEERTR